MKEIFGDKPMVAYRRPKNLKDVLVRAKLKGEDSDLRDKGMKKCGKSRCQISTYVHEGCNFAGAGNAYFINYSFDCDSVGVIYLITCKKCANIYVGNTITSFRKRFNNHKSSLNRFGKVARGIAGEHLYAHFFESGHNGLEDVRVPTTREGLWAYKLDSFIPRGLNITKRFFVQ